MKLEQQHIDTIVTTIRKIAGVQAAIPIIQSSIKEMPSLLEDLELHQIELKKKTKSPALKSFNRDEE